MTMSSLCAAAAAWLRPAPRANGGPATGTSLNRLRRNTRGLGWGLGLAFLTGAAAAQQPDAEKAREPLATYDADTVVATVGDENITLGDMIAARQGLPQQLLKLDREVYFRRLLDQLTSQQLLSQAAEKQKVMDDEAVKKTVETAERTYMVEQLIRKIEADPKLGEKLFAEAGLTQNPSIVRQVKLLRHGLLSKAYIAKVADAKLTDEALKALYEELVADERYKNELVEVRARHVLVKTKAEAEEILKELKAGKAFEDLAKARSIGPEKNVGGDLGYFRRGQMARAIDEAVFKLKELGDVSDIVKSGFGFHVIKLEDKRTLTFEQLKGFLRELKVDRINKEELARLRKEIGFSLAEKLPPAEAIADDSLLK